MQTIIYTILSIMVLFNCSFAQDSRKKIITTEDINNSLGNNNVKQPGLKGFYFSDQSCYFTLPDTPIKTEISNRSNKRGVISYCYQLKTNEYFWKVIVSKYESLNIEQFQEEFLKQVNDPKAKYTVVNELKDQFYNKEKILVRQLISDDEKGGYIETRLFYFNNRIMKFTISTPDPSKYSNEISSLFSSIKILSGESDNKSNIEIIEAKSEVVRGGVIDRILPEYPPEAKEKRIEGDVVVNVTIDEKGNVIEATIFSGNEIFHESALKAVKQWKFEPTLLYGKPVKISGALTLRYKL